MGKISFNWVDTRGFEGKMETERFIVVCSRCCQKPKFCYFHVGGLKSMPKKKMDKKCMRWVIIFPRSFKQ